MSSPLNPLTLPINGNNLIEASAGTGKTWNIAALFTRLIVLEHYSVDKILVVTFTKPATAELKTRLRIRLDEALAALQHTPDAAKYPEKLLAQCSPTHDEHDFLYQLLTQALQTEPQTRLQLRLKAAISHFDNAAIYTIHGFCQRILQDYAFYCQVPFTLQLEEDNNTDFTHAQDFWRTRVAQDATLAQLAYRFELEPKQLAEQLTPFLARPYLHFRQPETESLNAAQDHLAAQWAKVSDGLAQIQAAFFTRLKPQLDGRSYSTATYEKKFAALAQLSGSPARADTLWEIIKNSQNINPFVTEALHAKRKNTDITLDETALAEIAPLAQLGDACQTMFAAESNAQIQLAHELLHYLREQNEADKKHRPTRHFDDLLLDVYHALQPESPHANELAHSIARNWHVALIDEFQDTDPLQYHIFQAAFAATDTLPEKQRPALFMVGDPKQAIYSFRGADIFAYLTAAKHATRHYTLTHNRRSHARLINSISALFSREEPFALPDIAYEPVHATRSQTRLLQDTDALRFTWLNDATQSSETADELSKRAAQWCAREISDSLNAAAAGKYQLLQDDGKKRPLHAGQIAVLVRTHKDGMLVQRALKTQGVHSVLLSRNSVFGEEEAQALLALLTFFVQPQRTSLLNFVLSGCLFGYSAQDLAQLNTDEHRLTHWTDSAANCLKTWQQQGIYRALQQFFTEQQTEVHLLAQGSYRTLTNLHQLMELLANEDEHNRAPMSILQWLEQHIHAAQTGEKSAESRLLRLENDENLVKIVTMHASKGLQYPIVYCPFAWRASKQPQQKWFIVHHTDGSSELVHKDQLNQDDKQKVRREQLSEDLRLLYVALTRAQEQLNVYAAHYQNSSDSALAYLVGGATVNGEKQTLEKDFFHQLLKNWVTTQDTCQTSVVWRESCIPATVSGSLNTSHTHPTIYRAHQFTPRSFRFITHTSFTALSRQTQRTATMLPEMENALKCDDASPLDSESIITSEAFPKGVQAGVCLHEILEKCVWLTNKQEQTTRITEILTKYSLSPEHYLTAAQKILYATQNALVLPNTTLRQLPSENRLPEMGFVFHTQDFRLHEVQHWFATESELPEKIVQAASRLNFYNVSGFINGFIDLFAQNTNGETLIIDYKSHDLDDYTPDALHEVMAQHHYYLQALLYAIAAARYLQSRNALPQIIHIRYLFLRGLDSTSNNGIWAWDIATVRLEKWLTSFQAA